MSRVNRSSSPIGATAQLMLQQSRGGTSGAFLVRADDGNRYWCKALNNLQSPEVLANEQIVGNLGVLIGAPVCPVRPIYIPNALVGLEFKAGTGRTLEEGWSSGSLAVEPATETHDLASRNRDDNPRRQAGIYAFYDWLGGSDPQWLTVGSELMYYSHDHGHYFPGGPNWSKTSLQASAGAPNRLATPPQGLDQTELDRLATAIEAVVETEVVTVLNGLPRSWPPDDDALDALIDYVLARTAPVAQRLRSMVTV